MITAATQNIFDNLAREGAAEFNAIIKPQIPEDWTEKYYHILLRYLREAHLRERAQPETK